ncbi:MAG TPA: asparaginase domain-containing protein [Candidatus Saccharimonadales bacterium]|nr:asparaginase domain-containing protein [Candidatus Saccharimonadales bacterium]
MPNKTPKLHFVITGGTIDSVWSGAQDTVVVPEHSVLPDYFKELSRNLKFYEELIFTEVCMKDSRAITDDDRKKMAKTIEESKADKIIITHGTYTMPDTARFLKDRLRRKDQTIILTGSMVPIKGFDFSDGPFNLGYAVAQVQKLAKGIYVCMNARVFTPEEVAKNIDEGKFYSVFKDEQ